VVQARWSLAPRVSVQESYNDNLFATETNKQDDFATIISPGIDLKYETPTTLLDLDYEFKKFFWVESSEQNYSQHIGTLQTRKDFTPWFSTRIREVFISSEDPVEPTVKGESEEPSVRVGERNRYIRNILEPGVDFRFGERTSFELEYRNRILRNDAKDVRDQDENRIRVLLDHGFDAHNGFKLSYSHIDLDYGSTDPPSIPRDFTGYILGGRYTYSFDPITSVFFDYRYFRKELDQPSAAFPDYQGHSPKVGFSRNLHENISLTVTGGYDLRKAEDGDDKRVFTGKLQFSGQYKRLSADISGRTGFADDFASAESLGFNRTRQIGLFARYQFLERLSLDAGFNFEELEFTDIDRTDKYYRLHSTLNYRLFKWAYLRFGYNYNERDSSAPNNSYRRNIVFFGITFEYDIAERFQ